MCQHKMKHAIVALAAALAANVWADSYKLSPSYNEFKNHTVRYSQSGKTENSYAIQVPDGYNAKVTVTWNMDDYHCSNNVKSKDRFIVTDGNGNLPGNLSSGIYTATRTYTSGATISVSCSTEADYYREFYWTGTGIYRRLHYKDVTYSTYFVAYDYSVSVNYTVEHSDSGSSDDAGAVDLGDWSFSKLSDTLPSDGGSGSVVITCKESVWSKPWNGAGYLYFTITSIIREGDDDLTISRREATSNSTRDEKSKSTVIYSVGPNPNTTSRQWNIKVKYRDMEQTIKVKQEGRPIKEVRVTFDAQGGEIEDSLLILKNGSCIDNFPFVSKPGYVLDGWYTDASGGDRVSEGESPESDITYYAHWLPLPDLSPYKPTGWSAPLVISTDPEAEYSTDTTFTTEDQLYLRYAVDVSGNAVTSQFMQVAFLDDSYELGTFTQNGLALDSYSFSRGIPVGPLKEGTHTISVYIDYREDIRESNEDNNIISQTIQIVSSSRSWTTSDVDGGVMITGCSEAYGELVIPSVIDKKAVVAIADYAFFGNEEITAVTIPDSVKTIGVKAFKGCSMLMKLKLPSSLERLGQAAFQNCTSLREVEVPSGIDYLWSSTFEGCTSLERAKLPEGITAIGTSAFANCKALEEVNIPSTVKTIKSFAFFSCESLGYVRLPEGLTTIDQKAFKNCTAMTVVMIPSSVTTLGKAAFFNTGLLSVTVPGSVKVVDDYCFQKCALLGMVTLEEGVESTGASVWANDDVLEIVELPSTLRSLGAYAFFRCHSLTMLFGEEYVLEIGEKAFKHCASLTGLFFSSSVISIPREMCNYCTSLVFVAFDGASAISSIGQSAFSNCPALKSVAGLDTTVLKTVKRGKAWKR